MNPTRDSPSKRLWCSLARSLTDPIRILQGFALFFWGTDKVLKKACSTEFQDFDKIPKQDFIKILSSLPPDLKPGIRSESWKSGEKRVATNCRRFCQNSKQDLRRILTIFLSSVVNSFNWMICRTMTKYCSFSFFVRWHCSLLYTIWEYTW